MTVILHGELESFLPLMTTLGLRERKKQQTREAVAACELQR
jgi:hypothetical protein